MPAIKRINAACVVLSRASSPICTPSRRTMMRRDKLIISGSYEEMSKIAVPLQASSSSNW